MNVVNLHEKSLASKTERAALISEQAIEVLESLKHDILLNNPELLSNLEKAIDSFVTIANSEWLEKRQIDKRAK